ncbi:hypothetical protein GCM10010518_35230 [Kitasatospora cinereorecta]
MRRALRADGPPDPLRQDARGLVEVDVLDAGQPAPGDTDDRAHDQGLDQRRGEGASSPDSMRARIQKVSPDTLTPLAW